MEASDLGNWSTVCFWPSNFADKPRESVLQMDGRSCHAIPCFFGKWCEVYTWRPGFKPLCCFHGNHVPFEFKSPITNTSLETGLLTV